MIVLRLDFNDALALSVETATSEDGVEATAILMLLDDLALGM